MADVLVVVLVMVGVDGRGVIALVVVALAVVVVIRLVLASSSGARSHCVPSRSRSRAINGPLVVRVLHSYPNLLYCIHLPGDKNSVDIEKCLHFYPHVPSTDTLAMHASHTKSTVDTFTRRTVAECHMPDLVLLAQPVTR